MTNKELEQLINEYGKKVYSFCKYLTGNTQEADDLYQETFLTTWEAREKLDQTGNVESYILSVAVRLWKNQKRKYAWRKRIADMQPMDESVENSCVNNQQEEPEQQLLRNEQQRMIQEIVHQLPEKYRIVVLLFYMEEKSVSEIAKILHIPSGTVKSRLFQARKILENELEDVLNEK